MVLRHLCDRSFAGVLPVLSHRRVSGVDRVGGVDRWRREQGDGDELAPRAAATGRGGRDVPARVFHPQLQSGSVLQYPFNGSCEL